MDPENSIQDKKTDIRKKKHYLLIKVIEILIKILLQQ
jgi:hypothetical protein